MNNGAIVNASNLGQEMLLGGALTADGKPKGNNIRGQYSGVWIKVVPDSYWRQAAALCGITGATYDNFDKIQGYIANAMGFAFGRAEAQMNPLPNPGNAIGTKIQNLYRWGAACTRPSACAIIIESDDNLATFTNPISEDGSVVAPKSFNDTIKSYGVSNVDYGDSSRVGVRDGDTTTTVTLTVTGTASAAIKAAALSITDGKGYPVGYVNNADGTYTFALGRGDTATVVISAEGYENATVDITAANTAAATYAVTKALTAAE